MSIDGEQIENFDQIIMTIILNKPEVIEVERDGETVVLNLSEDVINKLIKAQSPFISYRTPFVINDFAPGSLAKKAGMQKGDRIIYVEDNMTPYYQDFTKIIKQYAGKDINIGVIRDNDTLNIPIALAEDALLGVYVEPVLELKTQNYSFVEAIPEGFSQTGKEISDYWKQLKLIFNPSTKAYESLGGFISIGSIFPDKFNWIQFWRLTAFLSIILAVMNILPIPALDGGHVLFLLIEMITRRKPSDRFMEIAQSVGLIILLILLIYANGNDIIRLFR